MLMLQGQMQNFLGGGGNVEVFFDNGTGIPRRLPGNFGDYFLGPGLDQLIQQALVDSPTLAAAEATLRQARENLRARTGTEYFPKVDASLSGSRQKVTGASLGQAGAGSQIFSLFNASVSVSYNLTCLAAVVVSWKRCRPRWISSASSRKRHIWRLPRIS